MTGTLDCISGPLTLPTGSALIALNTGLDWGRNVERSWGFCALDGFEGKTTRQSARKEREVETRRFSTAYDIRPELTKPVFVLVFS